MTTFIYNNSPLYTLLFKGGSLEIKPNSYIPANPFDLDTGVFKDAKASGQVEFYTNLDQIPSKVAVAAVEVVSETFVAKGLSEEDLKKHLETNPLPAGPKGVVEAIGAQTEPAKTTVTPEVSESVVVPEAPVENKKKRSSKAKGEQASDTPEAGEVSSDLVTE